MNKEKLVKKFGATPLMCSSAAILPSIKIVSTRIISYYSVCVDLSSVKAVHALEHCPCITDPKLGLNGADCGAVHYGLCSPLILPPAVQLQTLQTLTPIVAKVESYRDKIQAAIELLAVEEEPADLETLLRYILNMLNMLNMLNILIFEFISYLLCSIKSHVLFHYFLITNLSIA